MRLLIDNNLSVLLVDLLTDRGHDVEHVRNLGMSASSDAEILDAAAADDRIIVSADSDFGALLAATRKSKPSYVLLRRTNGRRAEELAQLLADNLPLVADDLEKGAITVLGDDDIRVRPLPFE